MKKRKKNLTKKMIVENAMNLRRMKIQKEMIKIMEIHLHQDRKGKRDLYILLFNKIMIIILIIFAKN